MMTATMQYLWYCRYDCSLRFVLGFWRCIN